MAEEQLQPAFVNLEVCVRFNDDQISRLMLILNCVNFMRRERTTPLIIRLIIF